MKIDNLLSRLKGVKRNGNNGWLALCPGHADTKPSLSIKEADGKILLHCHAGCQTEAIVERMGLTMSDLSTDGHKPEQRQIEAIYHYTGANGKPFEVVRTRPKGFYQRQPDGNGGYINNLKGITPTLYHQDKLRQAIDSATPIYNVEGEKDADRLWDLGLVVTTNPMGAGKWQDRYSETLHRADLIIIPHKDKPGREHGNHIARSCYGIAKRIRVLELPGDVKDVSDWLDEGHTVDELKELTDGCPDYEPSDNGVKLRCMADVQAEAVSWLWPPYIPKGKLTLEEGDPGVGKSWASLAIATAVTLGKGLPGQELTEPANVLIASAEDGLGDTIRPRLDAMGADVSRIFAIDGALMFDENGFALLEAYLEKVRPELLIIDPLVAYLGAGVDIHRANETRAVMAQLARIAEKFNAAILAIRHLTKSGMSKPIYRGLGSIDFTAACRSVLLAGCDAENPQSRALVHIKSNLAPAGPSIGYELREEGFYWTGESLLTAPQILAADNGTGTSELDEAVTFLKDELAEGPILAKDVYRDAEGIGISKRTLERAKTKLQAKSRKIGDTWFWCLPEPTSPTSPTNKYGELGDLETNEAKKEVMTEGLGDVNTDRREVVLGMPVSEALKIWTAEGKPLIHLGPGVNCLDLEKLLSSNVKPEHLKAVRAWLESKDNAQ
jgi:putative DNA primase/helicase